MTFAFSRLFAKATALAFALALMAGPALADTVNITFLLTNDVYKMSGGKERGGFARLSGAVKAERAKGGNVVYVHAGDAISPSLLSGFDEGEHIIALLNVAPPDLFVPGNHEFDFGPDVFKKRMAEADFAVLAANLRDASGNKLDGIEDTKMMEFGGVKVGIVGLTADDSPVKSSPGDLKFADTIVTGVTQAKALRDAGADLVVAVAHANRGQDREMFDTRAFDIILTGDDHDLMLFYDGRTVMAESKEEAEFVTAIDVAVDVTEDDGRRRVKWWPTFRIIDTATVEPDPDTMAKVEGYEGELSKELDIPVGTTATALDSRKATVRSGEAAIGNLIADAMREAVGADVALTNGGGIRGNTEYAPGTELTRRTILTELPFGNKTMKLKVSGQTILDALENGLSQVENSAGRFPHVSGMTVEADLGQPAGSRVKSVTVGGAPLDPNREYTLATNDYMAGGGDGYGVFRGAERLFGETDAKLVDNDVMVYVRKMGSVSPKVEGRMKTGG
ncbi:MAG TPA: 5'-nucleotidase C-terminal domain-containing protein [Hyphomicrobiales bacterium]|nr:5'-nucleotidase C-terminal domain-containing protein [Hyphomicrobiales bacterium]